MKSQKLDFIVIGLGFGDEGKGTITDFLVDYFGINTVIRFNGGSQAAHNVVTPEGVSHTFSQFGSGSFIKNCKTFLSSQMIVDPYSLLEEAFVLKQKGILNPLEKLCIDTNCLVVTPFHKMVGRIRELDRGIQRFGSTGKGVGEAILDYKFESHYSIFLKDFFNKKSLLRKIESHYISQCKKAQEILSENKSLDLQNEFIYFTKKYNPIKLTNFYHGFVKSYPHIIDRKNIHLSYLLNSNSSILFEGAQGTLLDPDFGFTPYLTKTKTTLSYAHRLIFEKRNPTAIGVIRCYSHRHGMGPLPTENKYLTRKVKEEHNRNNPWQGAFRIGWLDLVISKYSIRLNQNLKSIAITCLDKLAMISKIKVCTSYFYSGIIPPSLDKFFEYNRVNTGYRITGIIPVVDASQEDRIKITKILEGCSPVEFIEFTGWDIKLNTTKIPKSLKRFLEFLESTEGFALPISILSFGNTRHDKIIFPGKI